MYVIIFILILALLVLAHEFGHFICARKSGMRVYEFGFGFPPRAFGVYKDPVTRRLTWIFRHLKSEELPATVYSLNLLPLGGFCKIKGENGEQAQEPDSFGFHKAWKKSIVLAAGVTMNVILAAVLFGIGFMTGLPADLSAGVDNKAIIVQNAKVMVQQVEKDSPAAKGGIKFGDNIVSINSVEMKNSEQMVNYVREHSSEKLSVLIKRGKEMKILELTPVVIKTGEDTPRLGVTLTDAGVIRYPWYIAFYKGIVAAGVGFVNIFAAFYFLLKNLILGQGLMFEVAGPVGIAVMVSDSVRLGFSYLINLTAMLSLTLAVINILPIPALDGGRILFIGIEKIFRRPVPMKYEQLAHTIGFVLLMCLIILVTFRDVRGLF